MEHSRASGFSNSTVTAGILVAAVLGVGVWQAVSAFQSRPAAPVFVAAESTSTTSTAPQSDPIADVSNQAVNQLYSAYSGLEESGAYSTTTAVAVAGSIGQSLHAPISYKTFTAEDVQVATDTSYIAMMNYRAALQTSMKPLLNQTEPEYELFGLYVQTKQQSYLDELSAAAANYRAVATATAAIVVPADAVSVQLNLLNSLEEFAADIDALVSHAQDPIASTVLLENYNQGEGDVLGSFQALVTYEKSKTQ